MVDDATGVLYIGEEDVGIWRYSLDPGAARVQVAKAPSEQIKPDVEGLTLLRDGDSAFPVWRVDGDAPVYAGRFSGVAANGIDGITGTDGLDAHGGAVGSFPNGLLVIQDDVDTDGEAESSTRSRQNFKFVDWRAVAAALKLEGAAP